MTAATRQMNEQQEGANHAPTDDLAQASSKLPLFVDLDGTLIKTDIFLEALLGLLKKNPLLVCLLPFWLLKGRARLKAQVAAQVAISPESLPYHKTFLHYLRKEAARGRPLILLTGAPQAYAKTIADHLELFNGVHASTSEVNLVGKAKLRLIEQVYGGPGVKFAYAGNEKADLPIWAAASEVIAVNTPNRILNKLQDGTTAKGLIVTFGERLTPFKSFIKAIRVYQWVKNLLIFVPLAAAHAFTDLTVWFTSVLAFAAFSLCASSVYVLNDLLDLNNDRAHPTKRKRAFAAGDLPLAFGLVCVPLLLIAGFGLGALVSMPFLGMLGLYYLTTCAYSFKLKEKMLIDVIVLALLYNWRIVSGAVAVGHAASPWLLGFTCFLFYSLALAKRSSELYLLRTHAQSSSSGRSYQVDDLAQINLLGASSGVVAVLILALYINSETVQTLYQQPALLWPVCLAFLYWISRIWMLTGRGRMHQDPLVFALKDRPSYGVAGLILTMLILAALIPG